MPARRRNPPHWLSRGDAGAPGASVRPGQVVAAGDLTRKQRDELLVEMTPAVAELVLTDNYEQAETVSLAQAF